MMTDALFSTKCPKFEPIMRPQFAVGAPASVVVRARRNEWPERFTIQVCDDQTDLDIRTVATLFATLSCGDLVKV